MAPPDDSVPEPIPDRPEHATGEISMLPPEEASKVAAEIRAVAESRGEDSEVVELVEVPTIGPREAVDDPPADADASGRAAVAAGRGRAVGRGAARCLAAARPRGARATACACCRARTPRSSSSRCRAADQAALLLHFRPGQRRQWMRLLEPDDVADVIQEVERGAQARPCSRCSTRRPARRSPRCSRTPRTRPAA